MAHSGPRVAPPLFIYKERTKTQATLLTEAEDNMLQHQPRGKDDHRILKQMNKYMKL